MGGFGMAVHPELLYPPIELAHVAGLLEQDGHGVRLLDADAEGLDAAGALAAVCALDPGLVCLDSSSTSLDRDLSLAKAIRDSSGAKVAILGSQVTYTPGEIFEAQAVDVVVRGEPEYTVSSLARAVEQGLPLEGIRGTSWLGDDAQVVHEPDRPKIGNLDELPKPARHLLDNQAYRFPGVEGPITTIKSSRGCPFDCTFCGYTLAQGLRFRFRSPEHVLAEIEDLYNHHNLRHVVFRDPIFTTRKDRVRAICEGICERGMHDLVWQCETAVKTLDRDLLEVMARAGCRHISVGIESGNEGIQKEHCGNKLNDHAGAREVFAACREFGIESRAFCMIGFPEETASMADQTIDLVLDLDPDQVQFCAVTAYPGTPLYQQVKGTGAIDYSSMTGYQPLECGAAMSADEIQDKIRSGYRRFYLRPRHILRELRHPGRLLGRAVRYFTLFKKREV